MCDHSEDIKEIKKVLQDSNESRAVNKALLESLAQRFDEHVQTEQTLHEEHNNTLADLKNKIGEHHSAHHEYLKTRIAKDKKRAEAYDKLKLSAAQWGMLAVFGFIAKAVWDYIQHGGH